MLVIQNCWNFNVEIKLFEIHIQTCIILFASIMSIDVDKWFKTTWSSVLHLTQKLYTANCVG